MNRLFVSVFALLLLSASTHSVGQTIPAATPSCDPKNPSHVPGDVALRLSQQAKDQANTDCWTYVAVMQGNSTAEAYWAIDLVDRGKNDEAFRWAEKSAKQGNPHGAWNLSKFYENGVGTAPDAKKAAEWRGVALGDPELHALALKSGWLNKTAEINNHPAPDMNVSEAIPNATVDCDPRNPDHVTEAQAHANVKEAAGNAQQGDWDPEMMCWVYIDAMLGNKNSEIAYANLLYDGGDGVKQDYQASLYWATKSASQGVARAAEYLAFQYAMGLGTEKDLTKAKHWYEIAIKDSDVAKDIKQRFGENGMTSILAGGRTLPPAAGDCDPRYPQRYSDEEAYKRSVDKGRNAQERFCWLSVSAAKGNASSEADWAYMLLNGVGVMENDAEAFEWNKKAAEQGNAFGAYGLAVAYGDGSGTAPDTEKAKSWMAKALKDPELRQRLAERRDREEGITIANSIIDAMNAHDACEDRRTTYEVEHNIDNCGMF